MKEAAYFEKQDKNKVKCYLCPHNCAINDGKYGICKVRKNSGGTLYSEIYNKISSLHFDPVEKKPLYHFYPGMGILSIGSVGCNMSCKFCQNYEISQATTVDFPYFKTYTPEEAVAMTRDRKDNIGIAFTYNEPVIWFEYILDVSRLAKEEGLKTIWVTNGFINKEPLLEILPFTDAFNVDFKAFNNHFYKKLTGAKLEPVKQTLKIIRESGKHLELTNLVIPGYNDDEDEFAEMCLWIAENLGRATVLHISRYFPVYQMTVESTPEETLLLFYQIAREYLDYVYLGNTDKKEGKDTFCNKCREKVITRSGYHTQTHDIDITGHCTHCGNKVVEV